jgi:D-beta-D-heptose 7-phosphate kinase/D-beta-D-heptose 1-phosphate adenosyltransferase
MDIQPQKQYKVLLVGDSCSDVYHFGCCERLSPEAPVPILEVSDTLVHLGMAGNVKKNLEAFGVCVDYKTNSEALVKHRYIDKKSNSHLLRVDEGGYTPIEPLRVENINPLEYDALIISDYNKGFLPEKVCSKLVELFTGKHIFVDTKKQDLSPFKNCYLKLNKGEYESSYNLDQSSICIVTLGEAGAMLSNTNVFFPTKKVEVYDICGAGDVFLSAFSYFFLKTLNVEDSIFIANKFASYSVTKFGTSALSKEEIKQINE